MSIGNGFARPSPVQARPSAAVLLTGAEGLGQPEDLDKLEPRDQEAEACARVFAKVCDDFVTDTLPPSDQGDAVATALRASLTPFAQRFPHIDVEARTDQMRRELVDVGPLADLLSDDGVRRVFIHGPYRVVVGWDNAHPIAVELEFSCPQAIEIVIRRLTGSAFGLEYPVIDARTFDGHDIYAVHDSVATGGPVVNIALHRAAEPTFSLATLVEQGVMTHAVAGLLQACADGGLVVGIFAEPGASAFPLLAAMMEAAPHEQRQLVVRPGYEPGLLPVGAVVLEGHGLTASDGATVMQSLVRTALGLAPDRLVVHEVGGAEAADLFGALGRGLQGAAFSTRASTGMQCLRRLAGLVGLGGGDGGQPNRELFVTQSVDLLVGVARFADGRTRVMSVCEPILSPSGLPQCTELVSIDPQSGNWTQSGLAPTFVVDLQRRGIAVEFVGSPPG